MNKVVELYVDLLNECSAAARPVQAIDLGNGLFKILPVQNYKKLDEVWEFPPGSIVRSEKKTYRNKDYLLAIRS